MAVQSVRVLIGSPLFIAGKLRWSFGITKVAIGI